MKPMSFVALCLLSFLPASGSCATVLENNGIKVNIGDSTISSITIDGMPFSERAELFVVKPLWAGTYYSIVADKNLQNTVTINKSDDGTQTASFLTIDKTHSVLTGKQEFQLTPDRTLKISVEADNTSDCQAIIEHTVFTIVPTWAAGCPLTITTSKGKVIESRFPFSMTTQEKEECYVAEDFKYAKLKTRVGDIEFSVKGNTPLTILDYRMNPFLEGTSKVWFGVLSHEFPAGSKFRWEIEVKFPEKYIPKAHDITSATASIANDAVTLRQEKLKDQIIPTPKSVEWSGGNLTIGNEVAIGYNSPELKDVLQVFSSDAPQGLSVSLIEESESTGSAVIKARLLPNEQMRDEEYRLKIDSKTAVLEAQTTVGLLHATRTLNQLLRLDETASTWYLRQCTVSDWPVMPIRGVEFYTGFNAGDDQARVVRKLMGYFKMNMLIHHICFSEWASRPDLANPELTMSKAERSKVIRECVRQDIEYVPFLPAYGLLEWLRFKSAHPKSQKPDLSVWNDPEEQDALTAVFEECISEIHPKYVHIGHDELYTAPDEDLLASINKWHKWFKERGIKTMIWSDLFLSKGDGPDACNAATPEIAKKRRDMLPKDIIVTDWHYEAASSPDKYKSLEIFNNAGFDTIASSWFAPQNVVAFGKAAANRIAAEDPSSTAGKTLGQIATTWAGWNFNRTAMDNNGRQLADYILTAESAWVGGYNSAKDLPFDVYPIVNRLWNDDSLPVGKADGWIADLNSLANLPLSAKNTEEWLGFPKGENLSSIPTGETWLGRFKYNFPKNKCVLLSGKMGDVSGYNQLTLPVSKQTDVISFAVAATLPFPISIPIANTEITYDDNSVEKISWCVANNVYSIDDGRLSGSTPIIWEGKTKSKKPIYLHSHIWKNPHPGKVIQSVSFKSADQTSAFMIFGVSGVSAVK